MVSRSNIRPATFARRTGQRSTMGRSQHLDVTRQSAEAMPAKLLNDLLRRLVRRARELEKWAAGSHAEEQRRAPAEVDMRGPVPRFDRGAR
jgi:hypothetical protein